MGKLISQIAKLQDYEEFENLNWTGGFEDYLGLVKDNPGITRTAFERVYDMVLSHGVESYSDNKKSYSTTHSSMTHSEMVKTPSTGWIYPSCAWSMY